MVEWFCGRCYYTHGLSDCPLSVPVHKGKKVPSFRTWKPEDQKRCPMCKALGTAADFEETEVGCEDCGDHPAVRCRRCGESIDMIYRNETDFDP